MQRPSDDFLRKARTTLRSLASDAPSRLPSLNLVADAIRLQLEQHGKVAVLYVHLERYGELESVFGWRIVGEILDAVAASLAGMAGSTLRQLDADGFDGRAHQTFPMRRVGNAHHGSSLGSGGQCPPTPL